MDRLAISKMIESDEGFRSNPYLDTQALWTFGCGQCVERDPLTAEEWKHLLDEGHMRVEIDRAGAKWLMDRKIDAVTKQLNKRMPFFATLPLMVRGILIQMAFQMGVDGVMDFKDMVHALSHRDFKLAAKHGRDSLWWRKQTRARAERLMKLLESQ